MVAVSSVPARAEPVNVPPRSSIQLVVALLPSVVIGAVLVTRAFTGAPLWASVLGLVGCLAWFVRALLRPRLTGAGAATGAGAGGWNAGAPGGSGPAAPRARAADLALLLVMLVTGGVAAIPGDAAAFAPAIVSMIVVIGGSLLSFAARFAWCSAAAVLAAVGAFIGPFGPWATLSVGIMFVLAIVVGIARRHGVMHAQAASAAERARHEAELAAARGASLDPDAVRQRFPQLSVREAEVLGLMARGRSNAEIAQDLFLSVATVKSHVNALFAKLPARDRAHAIAIAYGTALPG